MKGFTNRPFFNRSLFRKQLLSYFVTVLIPTLMIVSVYSYTISEDLKTQIEQASDSSVQRVSKNIETLVDQINYFSLQLSFLPDMNRMLQDPGAFTVYDYYQLKEQMRNQVVSNKLFNSVYIYTSLNGRFMTSNEGLFDAATFFDKPVLEQIQLHNNETFWYQVRDEYITFYKALPVTAAKPLGTLVINIQKGLFLSTIHNLNYGADQRIFLVDSNSHVISPYSTEENNAINQLMAGKASIPSEPMQKIHIDRHTYFAHTQAVKGNGWTIVNLIPYELYKERLFEKMSKLLIIVLAVFLIGLAIAYAFAVKMYNPWKKIIEVLSFSGDNKHAADEFSLVSGAISSMMDTMKQNEPVMKAHLISDILRNNMTDKSTISGRLEQVGLSFHEPNYGVIVAVFDAMRQEDAEDPQRKLVIYSMVSETLKKYVPAEGTILDGSKLGFIVNLQQSSWDSDLRALIELAYVEMNSVAQEQLNVSLQLIVSEIGSSERLHVAYEQIRRILHYKAVINRNDVVFAQDHQSELKFVYPMLLQKQLIHSVTTMNREKAAQCVADLFEQYLYKSKYPLEKLQGMIVVLMSSVLNELLKEGHDIGRLHEEVDIFKLNECQNNDELHQFMMSRISTIIAFLESLQDRQVTNLHVSKTIAYMEQRFASNISIADIADHIGVSSGHLSRTFKAEMGKSMLEYLTEYRIMKSKELLSSRSDSLHEICQAVGYNDVQSFIRFFKKYEGMTPGEYRKSI
ncbi:AraC family transcriptional regulator [Paenibacillus aceris]|uniref:AraC-like DNA-binding protein n=1 Tax=Paenibacillus aceris TaxID=869555 RepID=A0ABS4I2C0_9BACL|nr:AraC family transcriptional regulator [Paenibacillus aceris]MBP1965050.1 AraC-like DNA-binding protein [Paenibacillus aceris]NHW33035.1 AraC family transcriptional regulator [Paenibacillus aceris]